MSHPMEIKANAFAMELLMPEKLLRADLAKMGGCDIENDKKLGVLAKKYQVSPTVMAVRIGQLAFLSSAEPVVPQPWDEP